MIIISVIIKSIITTSFLICVGFSCADLSKIGRAYLGKPNPGLHSKITESLPRLKTENINNIFIDYFINRSNRSMSDEQQSSVPQECVATEVFCVTGVWETPNKHQA